MSFKSFLGGSQFSNLPSVLDHIFAGNLTESSILCPGQKSIHKDPRGLNYKRENHYVPVAFMNSTLIEKNGATVILRLQSNFQWSVESILGLQRFYLTLPCDWSRKLAPSFQPIKSQTKNNRGLVVRVFPRLTNLLAFTASSHWLMITFTIVLIGHWDCFAFGFTTLNFENCSNLVVDQNVTEQRTVSAYGVIVHEVLMKYLSLDVLALFIRQGNSAPLTTTVKTNH